MSEELTGKRISRRELVSTGIAGGLLLSSGPRALAALTTATAVKGGTLRVGLLSAGSSETLDIRKPYNFPDFIRLFNLLDPLFFQVPHGLVSPGLATEAHPSKNFT